MKIFHKLYIASSNIEVVLFNVYYCWFYRRSSIILSGMIILWAFWHQRSTKCGKPSFPSLCPNQKGAISWHFLVFFAFVNLIFSSSFFSQALQAGDSWQLPAFLLPFLEIWFFSKFDFFSSFFFKAAPASNSWKSSRHNREKARNLSFSLLSGLKGSRDTK